MSGNVYGLPSHGEQDFMRWSIALCRSKVSDLLFKYVSQKDLLHFCVG